MLSTCCLISCHTRADGGYANSKCNTKGERLISIHNIYSSNTDQRELHLLAKNNSVVAVFHFLELVQRMLCVDLGPVYNSYSRWCIAHGVQYLVEQYP